MIGKKGMFGRGMAPGGMPGVISGYGGGTFDMDGTQVTPAYSMPQDATMRDTANLGTPAPGGGGKRPGLGTRLLGEGWEDKAMALGGALQGNQFAIPQYLRQQGEIRQQAEKLAAQQREQAQMMAAAQGMGIDPQQAALLGPEGLRQATLQRMKPPQMDEFDTAMTRAGIQPGTPQYAELAREYALRKAQGSDETVVVPIPGRGTFVGPRSALQTALGGGSQPATVPQSDWDSAKPMGGAGGNASGNFR